MNNNSYKNVFMTKYMVIKKGYSIKRINNI